VSFVDDLVSQIPVGQLAGTLGMSEADARAAVEQAVPAVLGGMAANAEDPAGAASLSRALGEHADDPLRRRGRPRPRRKRVGRRWRLGDLLGKGGLGDVLGGLLGGGRRD
jgi:hypothetical protein